MSAIPLPPDFLLRVRRLRLEVDGLAHTVSHAAAYTGLQPCPPMLLSLVLGLACELKALAADPRALERLELAGFLAQSQPAPTLLEVHVLLAFLRAALDEVSGAEPFGFAKATL